MPHDCERINIPNMRKTLEIMASDPSLVNMGSWVNNLASCGTTACMAGHAAVLVGEWCMTTSGANDVMVDGKRRPIDLVGAEVLGLSGTLADAFFLRTSRLNGRDAVAVLYRMAELVTNGEIAMPIEFEADYKKINSEMRADDIAQHYLYDIPLPVRTSNDDPYYCVHCGVSPCAHLTEDCG